MPTGLFTKHNYMDILIFLTLAYTGMRVGELVVLKWKDIDFVNQTISITKTYYNPNNTVQFQNGHSTLFVHKKERTRDGSTLHC